MWHSNLNDTEIRERKRFIPKGFELIQHWVSRFGPFCSSRPTGSLVQAHLTRTSLIGLWTTRPRQNKTHEKKKTSQHVISYLFHTFFVKGSFIWWHSLRHPFWGASVQSPRLSARCHELTVGTGAWCTIRHTSISGIAKESLIEWLRPVVRCCSVWLLRLTSPFGTSSYRGRGRFACRKRERLIQTYISMYHTLFAPTDWQARSWLPMYSLSPGQTMTEKNGGCCSKILCNMTMYVCRDLFRSN